MNKTEKAQIKGRTEAMEWCMNLVKRWRGQAEITVGCMDHSDACIEFAGELEKHIDEFANS